MTPTPDALAPAPRDPGGVRGALRRLPILCFRWEWAVLLGAVAMGLASLWLTARRAEGYDVLHRSYLDLYTLAEQPRIRGFTLDGDGGLVLHLANQRETRWAVVRDGAAVGESAGSDPRLRVAVGIHRYLLRGASGEGQVELSIIWSPGLERPLLAHTSIPIVADAPFRFADFVPPTSAYRDDEVAGARAVLREAGVSPESSAVERVRALARHLHENLYPHRGGDPTPRMRELSGFGQYEEAMAGRSEIYCANHSEIFAFMANVAGVPTRIVDVAGRVDGVDLGAHSFDEAYIEALDRWIYVDLQLSIAGIRDGDGRFLSAADLMNRLAARSTEDLVVDLLEDGAIREVPFAERADQVELFLHRDGTLVYLWAGPDRYALGARLWRLLLHPRPAYALAGTHGGTWWRLFLTYGALAAALLWLLGRARHHLGRCPCARGSR